MRRHKVIVEVYGGVATVTSCPPEVKVKVIDYDELHSNGNYICGTCRKVRRISASRIDPATGVSVCRGCRGKEK